MGLAKWAFRGQLVWAGDKSLSQSGNVRELSIVLYVVLEISQLLNDLLPLVYARWVRGLGTGTVGIVDGLCLYGNQAKVSKWPRNAASRMKEGSGRQTDYNHRPTFTGSGPAEGSLVGG